VTPTSIRTVLPPVTPAGGPIATAAVTAAGTGGTVPEAGGPQTSVPGGSTRVIRRNRAVWTVRTAVTRGRQVALTRAGARE